MEDYCVCLLNKGEGKEGEGKIREGEGRKEEWKARRQRCEYKGRRIEWELDRKTQMSKQFFSLQGAHMPVSQDEGRWKS